MTGPARRASDLSLRRVADLLRSGGCPDDRDFDQFLPRGLQPVSYCHWTPIAAVARAATWLNELKVRSVVDVGSGAGKFCVAAALASGCHFLGVEHRPDLVAGARLLAKRFGVQDRVCFLQEAFGDAAPPPAEAYYLYNPFEENLSDGDQSLDAKVELSDERYLRDVSAAEHWLGLAPVGTYVLTYNGFGGELPCTYEELRSERELPSVLRLWRKASDS